MVKIKKVYDDHILHAFDFDDTLVKSPSFEDIAVNYLTEKRTVKDTLNLFIDEINCKRKEIKIENGRLFINDPNKKYKETNNWKRKGNRLYLLSPGFFCYMDESLPTNTKELNDLYHSVENKCIITARPESIRPKIINTLKKFNIEYPNQGLYMCPDGKIDAGNWKGEKIIEIAKKHNFEKVIFYDDNSKYLSKVRKVINNLMPELELKTIKIL